MELLKCVIECLGIEEPELIKCPYCGPDGTVITPNGGMVCRECNGAGYYYE